MTSNCFGLTHQLHGAIVGEDVVQRHVAIALVMHFGDHLVPQHAGLHDVALLGGMHQALPLAREVEGDRGDALDLVGVVDLRVDGALLAVAEIGDGLGLAEIDAAGQLAHDHDVEAVDPVALERGGVGESGIADRRPEIGEQLKILAQPEQPGLGALVVSDAIPFRPADGAEHDGVGGEGAVHGRLGDRLAMRVVGAAADEVGLGLELGEALRVDPGHEAGHLAHHLGTDAVAGEQQKLIGRHGCTAPFERSVNF